MSDSNRHISINAKCPYYKYESKQMVYCASDHLENDSTIHIAFGQADECKRWKKQSCHNDYKHCFIFQMLGGDY